MHYLKNKNKLRLSHILSVYVIIYLAKKKKKNLLYKLLKLNKLFEFHSITYILKYNRNKNECKKNINNFMF